MSHSTATSTSEHPGIDRRRFLQGAGAATAATFLYTGGASFLAAPAAAATRTDHALDDPRWAIKPFKLDQVALGSGSIFAEKRDRILRFLAGYPADRVLHNFRITAGLPVPPGSSPPGGWDDEGGNLRGHYSGHLITAMSQAYASTKDPLHKNKVDYIVEELGKCQDALDEKVGQPAPPPPPVEWAPGKFGNAVRLNGSSQYVELPTGVVQQLHDFTVALWVRPEQVRSWSRIFDFGTGTSRNMFLTASAGGSGPRFAITTSGGSGEQRLDGAQPLAAGTWTHLAVTLSGNTGSLYVNGALVDTNSAMSLSPADLGATDRNWIGKSQYGDALLRGDVDECQIFSRALSPAEVVALTAGPADGPGDAVIRYAFDESAGNTAADASGNGRDATVVSESTGAPGPQYPGFLSAYPETQFIRLESFATYPTIWAPYYTLHKIMRGLVDAHVLTGNAQALDIVSRMGDWVHSRLSRVSREDLNRMWAIYIAGEYGGMNEVLADLGALTGEQKYVETAKYFDNRQSLFGACVQNHDILTRLHANTHVPQFVGYLRVFDQTGDREYFQASKNFFGMVVPHRRYSHGGTSGTWQSEPGLPGNTNPELFQPRGNIANSIGGNGAETCTSYNLLKVARNLFFHTADPAYMDYYERTLLNHILGSKEDAESSSSPRVTYFVPLAPGNVRGYGNTGTCCGGTGLENHTKYQESVYFRSADDKALFVNLYTASTLHWPERGFTVNQVTDYPRREGSELTVNGSGPLDVKLRVPAWARDFRVLVNGEEQEHRAVPGTYYTVTRDWRTGDRIEVQLSFPLRVEKATDDHGVQSLFHGPVLLPALGGGDEFRQFSFYRHFRLDGDLSSAVEPAGAGRFRTNGHTLRPMYVGDSERHHPYFRRHEPVVVFGSVDSGVPNYEESEGGDTFLDHVWAQAPFKNHGEFMAAVTAVSRDWQQRGLLSRRERTAVIEAADAAEADLRPSS
jgi:uncharacterized protein